MFLEKWEAPSCPASLSWIYSSRHNVLGNASEESTDAVTWHNQRAGMVKSKDNVLELDVQLCLGFGQPGSVGRVACRLPIRRIPSPGSYFIDQKASFFMLR